MHTRRQLLANGIAVIGSSGLVCTCLAQASTRGRIFGCILPSNRANPYFEKSTAPRRYITGQEPIIPKSGDKSFDYALAQTLAKISTVFDVLPGFAYYEDVESRNAYATPAARLRNADGTVLFGQTLLAEVLSRKDNPDVAVAAICAHEFGHILQFKHGLNKIVDKGQSTVKRSELQADYFAGYFSGIRKLEKSTFPAAVFAMTQFNNGDTQIASEGHHGTPEERGNAVSEGFNSAYRLRMTIGAAIEASTKYVLSL